MATKLQKLLESIDPDHVLDETSARADQALNSFSAGTAVITDWHRFRECLAGFCRHVETTVLRLSAPVDVSADFYWGRCVRFLLAAYGMSGDKAAFEMTRTGSEGGLYAVLRAVAWEVIAEYSRNEVAGRVTAYWNGLSNEERWAATDEYLAQYGKLLPKELTEGSAARVRADFVKVLEEHPHVVRELRRASRR